MAKLNRKSINPLFAYLLLAFTGNTLSILSGYHADTNDYHQGRGPSIRPTAALINIHEHLI